MSASSSLPIDESPSECTLTLLLDSSLSDDWLHELTFGTAPGSKELFCWLVLHEELQVGWHEDVQGQKQEYPNQYDGTGYMLGFVNNDGSERSIYWIMHDTWD